MTSCVNGDFGTDFPEEVHPRRYVKLKELPSVLFNKTNLPVIQLFGNENVHDDQLDELEDELMKEMYIEEQDIYCTVLCQQHSPRHGTETSGAPEE